MYHMGGDAHGNIHTPQVPAVKPSLHLTSQWAVTIRYDDDHYQVDGHCEAFITHIWK